MTQHLKNNLSPEKNQTVRPRQAPAAAGCPGERSDLPCLYSNNSIENVGSTPTDSHKLEQVNALAGLLTPYHKKQAQTIYLNTSRLISISPSISHIGFLTLTFKDNVTDPKEAYKRFRSFNNNYLKSNPDFGEWMAVKERQKRGAWHYHLLIQTTHDIRHGINFDQLVEGNYSSANGNLRKLWKDLRNNLPKYGLGRSELLPIKTNQDGVARYMGKYVSKHLGCRTEDDRGVRLVNSSRGWAKNSVRFSWNTDGSKEWRRKLKIFANMHGCRTLYALKLKLGPNWAYWYSDLIYRIDDVIKENQESIPF